MGSKIVFVCDWHIKAFLNENPEAKELDRVTGHCEFCCSNYLVEGREFKIEGDEEVK